MAIPVPSGVPQFIAGRYRVLRELGRGGFGAVYLVEHTNTGDRLALKVLYGRAAADPMSLERFKREARASAKIRSENVVKVIDADAAPELGGAPFLVMELLDGKDMEQLVEARGALLPEEVVGILTEAARALDKAHAIGIVHRDLKPENMFLHRREDGTHIVKILDFGISKSLGDTAGEPPAIGMTSTGAVLGTPLYMAPEQARGITSAISPATDVWSVGLIAYRLLTGSVYWTANTIADLMVQIVAYDMAPPSSQSVLLPPAFDAWFARSCNRDASLRFATVGEQVQALAVALGHVRPELPSSDVAPLSAIPLGPLPTSYAPRGGRSTGAALANTQEPPKSSSPRRGMLVGAGVAVVAIASGAFVFFPRTSTNAPSTAPSVASPSVTPATTAAVASQAPSALASASLPDAAPPPIASAPPAGVAQGKRPGVQPDSKANPKGPVVVTPVTAPPAKKRFDPDAP